MWHRIPTVALVLAGAQSCLTACGGDEEPASPFGPAQLVFVAPVDGVEQLWLASTHDNSRWQLTFDERVKALPIWSADGERLAFVAFDQPETCARHDSIMIEDDQGRRELVELDDVRQLAFDASGESLLVVTEDCSIGVGLGWASVLHRVHLADGEVDLIATFSDAAVVDAGPQPGSFVVSVGAWDTSSADMDQWSYEPPDVFVGDADGQLVRIVDNYAYDTEVDWHPSGERIAFQTDWENGGVYSIATDGSDLRLEAPIVPNIYEFDPRWSPDGRSLMTWRLGWGTMPDGTVLRGDVGERVLAGIRAIAWSPDQTMLLIESPPSLDVPERVLVLVLDDASQRDLGEGHDPAWRPR